MTYQTEGGPLKEPQEHYVGDACEGGHGRADTVQDLLGDACAGGHYGEPRRTLREAREERAEWARARADEIKERIAERREERPQ